VGSSIFAAHGVLKLFEDLAKQKFEQTRTLAEKGDVNAQYNVGIMYDSGAGVPKDFTQALQWYRRAADLGHVYAQYALGLRYYRGEDVARDITQALQWFQKAAEQGDVDAQFSLGGIYFRGDGVPRDFTRALQWYQKAADQGLDRAQVSLGGLYAAGEGVPKDLVIAYVWFNLAAAQGNGQAKGSRDTLETQMTREQVAEAQRLSSEWKENPQAIQVSPTIANVRSLDPRIVQTGSGFFITDDGFLLTAAHVVSGLSVSVRTTKGEFPAQVIKVDNANDIALLKVSGMFPFLPLGNAANAGLGEAVFTIGYPNVTIQGLEPKLTKGEINALSGLKDDPRHFQISTPVQTGNSGGPLVDEFGNVVGLVVTKLDAVNVLSVTGDLPQNVNYAIKINYARILIDSIPEVRSRLAPASLRIRPFDEVVKQAQSAAVLILTR